MNPCFSLVTTMAPEKRERASSGNPSDDNKQEEGNENTPKPPLRFKIVLGKKNSNTDIHQEDNENQSRIENREEVEQDESDPTLGAVYVCEYCGSEFSSARALGGHKRIHGKNKKSGHHEGSSSSNLDKNEKSDEYCCDICPMKFPSEKALYGHMRTHPERTWRGMNPPSKQPSPRLHSETGSRNCSPPNGLLVAKGGMRNRINYWKGVVDDDVLEGAVALFMLSRGGVDTFRGGFSCFDKNKKTDKNHKGKAKIVESEPSESDTDEDEYMNMEAKYLKRKRHYVGSRGSGNLNKDQKIESTERMRILKKANSNYKGKAKIVEYEYSDSDTEEDEFVKVEAKYLKRKRLYLMRSRGLRIGQSYDHDQCQETTTKQDGNSVIPCPSTQCLKKYECITCNKSFSSKQGLGGHMSSSSHKTKENAKAKASLIGNKHLRRSDNDSNNNVDSRIDSASLLMDLANNSQDGFEISNETVTEESNNTRKNVQGFDLNELPSMDDVGEEHS